jgi:hypothetical protein
VVLASDGGDHGDVRTDGARIRLHLPGLRNPDLDYGMALSRPDSQQRERDPRPGIEQHRAVLGDAQRSRDGPRRRRFAERACDRDHSGLAHDGSPVSARKPGQ